MTSYWIGVASRDHVKKGVDGGFCQLNHGKAAPVRRLAPGDWLIYYSPRTEMRGGDPVQAFTAIGRIEARDPYEFTMENGFTPTRRDVDFLESASDAPIRPLLEQLSFTRGRKSWGYLFKFGVFRATEDDLHVIARAMGVEVAVIAADQKAAA